MAIITELFRVDKRGTGSPSFVECGYALIEIDGVDFLVLETYGSAGRKVTGKVSQSLHFDRDHAQALKAVLEQSFPGI